MKKMIGVALAMLALLGGCGKVTGASNVVTDVSSALEASSASDSGKQQREIGDTVFYEEAIMVGERVYSGSKNRLISFNEDLSDIKVIYEYPDTAYFFWGIIQFDENTICACFWNNDWRYGEENSRRNDFLVLNLTNGTITQFSKDKDICFPFQGLDDTYYFKIVMLNDFHWYFEGLYKENESGEDNKIFKDIDNFLIHQKGVYLIDRSTEANVLDVIYYYDFITEKTEKIVEIQDLKAYRITNDYIIYSAENSRKVYVYDIVSQKTNDFTNETGIEFYVSGIDTKNGHAFVYERILEYEELNTKDFDLSDMSVKEAAKADLPGYIGEWCYYIVTPPSEGSEEEIPEEEWYTLKRNSYDRTTQFVY